MALLHPSHSSSELRPALGDAQPFAALPVEKKPDRRLMTYFTLTSFLAGPLFIGVLIPLYVRYRTLRYEIDDEGITMRRGLLIRREVSLNYGRIQDIHLSSNVVERWLGLARVEIQTASGSAKAEMTIEGLLDTEAIRDFLYSRMRGARDLAKGRSGGKTNGPEPPGLSGATAEEVASALREVAAELRSLRASIPTPSE